MPLEALQAGLSWAWSSYADWLSLLDGKIAVNAGFLAGHSALRRVVMGDDAVGLEATAGQIDSMKKGLRESLEAGALGFSSSQAPTHHDGDGNPVPSRAASVTELLALASTVSDFPGTTLQVTLPGVIHGFTDDEVELMIAMSLAAGRPVNWSLLNVSAVDPESHERQLAASDRAANAGARIVALTLPRPISIRLSLLSGFLFNGLPGWRDTMALPVTQRIAAFADPETRRRLQASVKAVPPDSLNRFTRWEQLRVVETFAPENADAEGRTVGEIAEGRGLEPFDALLDIAVADELRTGLRPAPASDSEDDWKLRAQVWRDHRTIIGGSDAGAHLDMMCGAIYSTSLLGDCVRERRLLSLEEAVHQLTDVPASYYGLRGRGRVAEGWAADLVLFDPDQIGYGPERTKEDLPGGASRLYAEADGVVAVFVNGAEIVREGSFTGRTPGTTLRSGSHTETVRLSAARP
jgi:N-acyl-D-aspartate/D-glutamate deacylase